MRVALISDIHGNLHALEAVLADIRRRGADAIAFLGDLCFNGGFPRACMEQVRDRGIPAIHGNTDLFYLDNPSPSRLTAWGLEELGEEGVAFLKSLPFTTTLDLGGVSLRLVHATPKSVDDALLPTSPDEAWAAAYDGVAEPIAAYGHIHTAFHRRVAGKLIINPGAVGLPLDGDPRPAYALVDQSSVTHVRVDYDREAYITACRQRGMPGAENVAALVRNARRG